jgi:hypothetical protein
MVDKFFTLGKPCFYIIQSDKSAFQDRALHLAANGKGHVIRIVRGEKSKDVTSFFDEVAAALQFPYYFGENWPAFEECITDLDWTPGDAYLLMVNDASFLLRDADSLDFRTLLHTLEKANEEWLTPNAYMPRQRQPTPFHVLFQCTGDDIATFVQRLSRAGVTFEQI